MEKLVKYTGQVLPLDMADVDTDQIIPKQFLKRTGRDDCYGDCLFYNWRFNADGSEKPEFILNSPQYRGSSILLGRENFGCGSSREHAPWSLLDYGFRAVIAPSFADIFRNNSLGVGLLPVALPAELVEAWFQRALGSPGYEITVDLPAQTLTGSDGYACSFEIDPYYKERLIEGLDQIDLTFKDLARIEAYESSHQNPWQAARVNTGD